MKIAIPAEGSTSDSPVSLRFSSARYIMIFNTDTDEYEAVPNNPMTGRPGAGLQAILLAVRKGADVVLAGYVNPAMSDQLKANDIEIIAGFSGTVENALKQYREKSASGFPSPSTDSSLSTVWKKTLLMALKNTSKQFAGLLPVMISVVFLTGLLHSFVPKEILSSLFTGNALADTVRGASLGSILAGNPVNSYIIGGELLKNGVSLFAVTAFMISWVTVGIIQLPAEIAAFGIKFALIRNTVAFVLAIPVSMLTVIILQYVTGMAL